MIFALRAHNLTANISHTNYLFERIIMNDNDQTRTLFTTSLSQTFRAYASIANKIAANYGLTQATAWPAIMISRLGNHIRPGALADALGLDPSSLVRIVDQLVQMNIVARVEDPEDRRAKILNLTPEGEKIIAQAEKALTAYRNELLKDVKIEDIQVCVNVLKALRASIKNYDLSR